MKNKSGVSLITLIITIIVVIILAVIVLRSGAGDAPDQAAFSGFTQEMGELQDAVKTAMLEAKADELLEGNQRTEAQLYNFVARGGYDGFVHERKILDETGEYIEDVTDADKWLTLGVINQVSCTPINKLCAKTSIGIELPNRKVETDKGVEEEMTYFVTSKGTVFCWPPYVYDGKSYVNAETTVKSGDKVDENGILVKATTREELGGTDATKDGEFVIVFSDDEYVKVLNAEEEFIEPYTTISDGKMCLNFYGVMYAKEYTYVVYKSLIEEEYFPEPEEAKKARGSAKGYDFYRYDNSGIADYIE